MKEFKVGDVVYTAAQGRGVIKSTTGITPYPICVKFDIESEEWFTEDGKFFKADISQILFHNPCFIVEVEADEDYPYVRVDECGEIYAYGKNPSVSGNGWISQEFCEQCKILNWETTGVDIKKTTKTKKHTVKEISELLGYTVEIVE